MRIRSVRPDFWQDDTLGHLPDAVRLFYIGLWCVADDAGWLEWKPAQLGAALYPYRSPASRQRSILAWGQALASVGRVVMHDCGCAYIPTLSRHQRAGGNPSYQFRDRHVRMHSTRKAAGVRTDTAQELALAVGEVSENARTRDDADPWHDRVLQTMEKGKRR